MVFLLAGPGVAALLTDDFSGASIDGAKWRLPPSSEGTGQMLQTGGRLEFTASVTLGGSGADSGLEPKAAGMQGASWYVEVSTTLDAGSPPFPGMGPTDVVSTSLEIAPSGPDSWAGGEDRYDISIGFVDFANFGSSGLGYGIHQTSRTDGTDTTTLSFLGSTSPQTVVLRIEYDAISKKLKALYDSGSGLTAFGVETDTATWNMGASEAFRVLLYGYAGNMNDGPATGTFVVGSGQCYFDDFVASGDGIVIIPEPAFGAPLALLALALVRAAARRGTRSR